MKKIRLLLIEDNRLLRDGITAMLKKEPDISVIDTFDDSDFVLSKINELKPHVILLDLGLAVQDSLELVKSLKVEYPDVNVIVMDLIPVQEDMMRYIEAGVSGFILKDATIPEFTKTIRLVACGEKILPTKLVGSLFSQIMDYGIKVLGPEKLVKAVKMTKREREIVELIDEGLANKEIANKLNLSIFTVKAMFIIFLKKWRLIHGFR